MGVFSFVFVRPVVAADVPGTELLARSRHPHIGDLRKSGSLLSIATVLEAGS
jgi:hypothetical protein